VNQSPPSQDMCRTVVDALERRHDLSAELLAQDTDTYRLFHGSGEGLPGVTLDRYGDLALLQSFHAPLPEAAVAEVANELGRRLPGLDLVYNDRSGRGSRVGNRLAPEAEERARRPRIATEAGVRFHIRARHRGQDPWLFLDLRPTRRAIAEEAAGRSLLNLFAYTCGAGVAAAVAGASKVVNVDFARSSLEVGTANAEANAVSERCREIAADVFPVLRQMGGIRQPPVVRGRRLPPFPKVEREAFDLVLLDPPPLARSPFGVVDLVRDYQSVLKPALAAVAEGGILYCTNNVARVDVEDWKELVLRCAAKSGRPVRQLDLLGPGKDFPSPDGRPPLKVARLEL
jgi:23S rRNA (cytosine1962-C5)-methyltransferase